jgi:hypothetical protein
MNSIQQFIILNTVHDYSMYMYMYVVSKNHTEVQKLIMMPQQFWYVIKWSFHNPHL